METNRQIINFSLSFNETSKDSNGSSVSIQVFENGIKIVKKYHGFDPREEETYEKEMSDEKKQKIMDFVVKNNLNINVKEIKDTDGIGVAGYLKFDVFDKDTTSIQIVGEFTMGGTDSYVKKTWGKKYVKSRTNIENITYFDTAKDFVRFIDDL